MLVFPKPLVLPLLSPSYSATFAFGRPEEALKDRERDKDREKRSLLSDTELSAIRRNAAKLLELHEALSPMLADAVRASGWVTGLNALEGSEDVGLEPSSNDDGDAEERFETALRSVAALFTAQVGQTFPCDPRKYFVLVGSCLHFCGRLRFFTCTRFSVRNTLAHSKL